MRRSTIYGKFARLPWPGYRGKILFCAALPSIATWAALAMAAGGEPTPLLLAGGAVAAGVSLAGLFLVSALLEPVRMAAEAVRDPSRLDEASRLPRHYDDEAGRVLAGIADLAGKIAGLHHRWVQRHPLTNLPVRESLLMEMAEDLDGEGEMMLGVLRLADYDRLAAFDSATAEAALKAFADRLAEIIGKDRPLAHVDRDSFAIWFRGLPDAATAASALQAACYALGSEIAAGDLKLVPDLEVGAAVYPRDGSDPAQLINRALVSLGKPGQGAQVDYNSSASKAKELFTLEQDLRRAIARDQLELHFQPLVDLAKRRLVGAEALLRWHHPDAGPISPSCFVPILEEAGLTDEVGMWTLNAACREARNWQRNGLAGLKVAVNLSATQLRDPGLKQMIARTLDRHKLHPQALELELTETAATEDAERTFALFGELRAMGISLAIDDFGSGYSSLSYVKNLPFDKLKIDREFVVRVHERRDSQAICRSLIELTRGLGIKLLAEGVEDEEEVRVLRNFGCTLFQGFYFSRPLPAAEFIRRAQNQDWPQLQTGSGSIPHPETETRIPA